MPRKTRRAKRRPAEFTRTTLHFLETGDIEVQPGDNPWIAFSLSYPEAREMRAAWLAGDAEGVAAARARIPGLYL